MPRRLLMIRLSAIGDVINTLPSISLLRRHAPDDYIAFAVEDKAKDVILHHPELDDVIIFPRRRWRRMLQRWDVVPLLGELFRYFRMLRRRRFDVALDFQGNLKGAMHSWLCGAARRLGFAKGYAYEKNHWFSTEQVVPPSDKPHRVDKFASLLQPLGIEAASLDYCLPSSKGRMAEFIRDHRRAIVIHPGTSEHGVEKRWPVERYGELAARAAELELTPIVTWGPGERPMAEAVCAHSRGKAVLAPPTTSLLDLAEIIRGSLAFVSADTGPMHLAAACRIPCIALFGPKDPATYRPYGTLHTVIYRPEGMSHITVDEVLRAVSQKIGAYERV
jgi:lipopolysaccharide heptosyltransferase I